MTETVINEQNPKVPFNNLSGRVYSLIKCISATIKDKNRIAAIAKNKFCSY